MVVAELIAQLQRCPRESPVRLVIGDAGTHYVTVEIAEAMLNEVDVVLLMPSGMNLQALTANVVAAALNAEKRHR